MRNATMMYHSEIEDMVGVDSGGEAEVKSEPITQYMMMLSSFSCERFS